MTIALTGAGGLMTRAGHIGGVIGVGTTLTNPDVNSYSGTTMLAKVDQIATDFAASPDNRPLIDLIFTNLFGWQSTQLGFLQQMQQLLSNTLVTMANQDTPLPSLTVQNAMTLLIAQMTTAVASVKASVPSVGVQTAVGSPTGNPVIVMSIKDGKGLPLQYLFAETMTFTCVADAQTGGTQLNQERMQITGGAAVGNALSYQWPGGSGTNQQISATDASQNVSAGNALYNSDFETFTVANTPDNWPIVVGSAGVQIFSSATAYSGTKSLEFLGDGANLTQVRQQFNQTSGGTTFRLLPDTQYALQFWIQTPVATAAGVLTVDLFDGSSVITDDQAVANTVAVTLSGLTPATWTSVTAVFRTPVILPASQYIRIRLSTAATSSRVILIDRMALTQMTQLYTGGPSCAIFSESSPLIRGDTWTFAMGNTWGLFQRLFERCFGMRTLGLTLPNNASPTISDSLIA